jgi:hypothetical protein
VLSPEEVGRLLDAAPGLNLTSPIRPRFSEFRDFG